MTWSLVEPRPPNRSRMGPIVTAVRSLEGTMAGRPISRVGAGFRFRLLREFCADECGAELVEWMLLTMLVVLGSWVALDELREVLAQAFETVLGRFVTWD